MKVFLTVTSLGPAYGGPARSVAKLAATLATSGLDVGLWAPDASAATTPFLPTGSAVRRLSGSLGQALQTFGRPDLIHDNGIWLPHQHRLARLAVGRGVPRVVSTRGMLEPWALRHRKLRKSLAWQLYQHRDLRSAACHHVTSPAEAATVASFGWAAPIREVPNGIEIPTLRPPVPGAPARSGKDAERSSKTALFVGRIHSVKGLDMLVQAWSQVRPVGWKMVIVGPDEAGHRSEVEAFLRTAGVAADFEFLGELEGDAKQRAYLDAELFVLPSYSENFGMAIGEALSYGLPVITTKGTPWQRMETFRCGWWTDIHAEALATALREATSLTAAARAEMGARGRAWVRDEFGWSGVAERVISMYEEVL